VENLLGSTERYRDTPAFQKALCVTPHLVTEILGNLTCLARFLKRGALRSAGTLTLVKLMDYSDHLPQRLAAKPLRIALTNQQREELIASQSQTLLSHSACPFEWAIASDAYLEISYNASLGEAEVHPHIVQARVQQQGGQNLLQVRYFDDESTVWQGNPCRASTVTVAELMIDTDRRELRALRYLRYRSPKRRNFKRRETLRHLHALLDSGRPFLGLEPGRITFGVELTTDRSEALCRFAPAPGSKVRALITSTLLRAQLSVVTAIMTENIIFTLLANKNHKERACSTTSEPELPLRRAVLRMRYGKKQLRLRTLESYGAI
jgi:hypothetical protein